MDDINEEEKINPRVQAMFKQSRQEKFSILLISQDYYKLRKRTIRANGNIYRIFTPNNLTGVQNLYQDQASMDMTLNEFKLLSSTCLIENYQPLTIDMTKDENIGCYRFGLNSLFVPDSSAF